VNRSYLKRVEIKHQIRNKKTKAIVVQTTRVAITNREFYH